MVRRSERYKDSWISKFILSLPCLPELSLTSLVPQPPELRRQVLNAYARSLNFPWIICTPLLFIGFLISFLLKHYSMERAAVKAPRKGEVVPEERGEKLEEVGTKEDVVAEAEASGRDQRAEVEGTEEVWQREGTKEVV